MHGFRTAQHKCLWFVYVYQMFIVRGRESRLFLKSRGLLMFSTALGLEPSRNQTFRHSAPPYPTLTLTLPLTLTLIRNKNSYRRALPVRAPQRMHLVLFQLHPCL